MSGSGSDDERVIQYALDGAAIARHADALGDALVEAGCRPGDLVAVLAGNHPGFVAARDAATLHELVFAPLNPRLAAAEVAQLCAQVRPRVIMVDRAHSAAVEGLTIPCILVEDGASPVHRPRVDRGRAARPGLITVRSRFFPVRPERSAKRGVEGRPPSGDEGVLRLRPSLRAGLRSGRTGESRRVGPADQAAHDAQDRGPGRFGATVLFTSGTTGRPKACLRPEAAETARAAELTATYGLGADDVHLVACPLAHSAPGILLRAARAAGARTVVLDRFRPRGFLAAAADTGATLCFLVPTQWYRLLELPPAERPRPDALRTAIVAGAPLAPAIKDRLLDWLGPGRLWEFYGSSETGTVSVIGPGEHRAHPGSVGRPPAGVSVRILGEDGAPVPVGHLGEVFVGSGALMAGYLDDAGGVSRPDPHDGHISVGDLGRVDADGWLTLVDRKHDTIISGGSNVYPAEIEAALAEHPALAGAVVFGIDDAEWGQVVTALIAPRGAAAPTAAELTAFCRARVAGYKLPRRWAICAADDLPIGGSGKALRRAARAAFSAGRYEPLV